jgi:hypothetical protein
VHHRLADWLDRRRGFAAAGASPSRHSPPKRLNPTPRGGDWRGRGRGFSALPSSRTRATGQRKSASETHTSSSVGPSTGLDQSRPRNGPFV